MPVIVSERLAVRGRPLQLERAVANLADNAGRYGRDPRIAVRREGDAALIEVIDRGPGIPPERRLDLLEPFVRGDAARTMNDHDGFGLGLTIARTIAEAHGGVLELADGDDGTFVARLRLPLD
jgi:signal transduction histidine kinase